MSTVILSGYFIGYALQAPYGTLIIATDGTVGAGGVTSDISNNYTVINSGRIGNNAATNGVLIFRGGTVINNLGASITGGVTAVDLGPSYQGRGTHTSFGSVVNNGSIVGGTGDGIYLGGNLLQGGFVTNGGTGNTGALIRGASGIDDLAGVFATIATTIDNFGTIQGTGGVGFAGISMDEGTPGTIVNGSSLDTAALISGYIGVDGAADGPMVLQNFGTIEGTGSIAVLLGSSADTLIDEAHAVFIGTVDGAGGTLQLAGSSGAGALTGIGTSFTNFSNVSINSGATWTLTGANTIAAGATLTDDGTLIDTGSISGGINLAATGALLSIAGGGYLSNNGTGSAVYSRYGVSVVNQGTIDVQAPGASAAGYYGVHLANGGSVNNSGTITGNNFAGLRVLGGVSVTNSGLIASGRAGVFADFGVNIDNTGRIHGPVNGVFARNGSAIISNAGAIYGNNAIWVLNGTGTIANSGTLQGLADRAVSLTAGGTVTNQAGGLITAPDNNTAVYVGGVNYAATASGVVTNAGTIAAGTGIAFYAGDTLSQTVIDSGTIIGSNGTAIAFSAGNDTLRLQPSTSVFIQGIVDGGGGTNTLAFASGATTGTLTGLGADFVGFSNGTVDAGAAWVLAGSNTLGSGTTLRDSGTLTVAGTLVNAGTMALADYHGLQVAPGGNLTNAVGGVISLTSAHYEAFDPVVRGLAGGASTITNLGTIRDGEIGVFLAGGGTVNNGASDDTGAVIYAHDGVYNAFYTTMTVVNYGTIVGNYAGTSGDHRGVDISHGVVINGASDSTAAYIVGGIGIEFGGHAGTVVNWGTIRGNYANADGVEMYYGSFGTVIDGGTIIGSANAINFNAAVNTNRFGPVGNNLVELYTSAVLIGDVVAAGPNNRLELATGAGTGTIASIGTSFQGFATITVDAGASWSLGGVSTHAAGVSLVDSGTLQTTGTMTSSGTLIDAGTLVNAGTLLMFGQALQVAAGGSLINTGSIGGNPGGGAGVSVAVGGFVTDQVDGVITGYTGIIAAGAAVLTNAGTIGGNAAHGSGIRLQTSASVTNQASGTISGFDGVYAVSGAATVANAGSIAGAALGGIGADLRAGGRVTNQSGGTISGGTGGVWVLAAEGTVVNAGSIDSTDLNDGYAVLLNHGGSVTNQSGGVMGGERGVEVGAFTGTVTNAGTIAGTSLGVAFFNAAGTLTNQSGGTISGGLEAVRFAAGYNNLLVIDPGAVFVGTVTGLNTAGATAVSVLELAAGPDAGTLAGLGTRFVDFVQSTIDSGASWTFAASNTSGAGYTLTNDGTLTNTGTLINAGALFDNGVMLNSGAATLSGPLIVAGTLDNAGRITVARYRALQLSPSGYLYNEVDGYIGRTGVGTHANPVVFAATGGDATIRNLGTIKNATGDFTVYLTAGGTITNGSTTDTTALIEGKIGVYIDTGRGIVTNFGTIETSSDGGPGIELNQGGIVVNGASGSTAASILGVEYGVFAVNGPTTLINFGTITGSYASVGFYQRSGVATIFNAGWIEGGVGIELKDGGTIVDSGAIAGNTYSIRFGGTGSNLLVLEQGYEFFGVVQGSAGASNTLELVGSVGSAVTVRGLEFGVGVVNFQTVEFGPGAGNAATLDINNNAELPGTIAGFIGVHDRIDLTALSDVGNDATTSFNAATDVLTVTGDNGSVQLQLDNGDYSFIGFAASNDGNGGTMVTPLEASPPAIGGTVAGQAVTDEATDHPFASVTITDGIPPDQSETITITLDSGGSPTDADGILSGAGLVRTGTGTYTLTAADAAAAEAALQALVFTPTTHQVAPGDTVTTDFTIGVTDAFGQTATDSTTTVIATAVNDPPTINPPPGNTGVPNETATTPFADLVINDPDVGHVDTITVTLSDPSGGTLSNLAGGLYDPATGVYTISGSAGVVTAALQGLVFTPNPPANGAVGTTSFTVAVTGPGGSASDSSISVSSVQQVGGLGGIPASQDVISVSPDGTDFAPATPGMTNQAVVSDPSSGITYTLPTGYQAEFLGGTADAELSDPSNGNALLVGNSGNDTLVSGAAKDTIVGGSATTTIQFTGDATGGVAFGGTGNAIILDAGRNDTLSGASGTTSATISGSSATFFSQASDATVLDTRANATLVGGSFQSSFQLTSSAMGTVVFGGTGSVAISDAGSNDTIAGAADATSATTSGSNAVFFGEAGAASVLDSGANSTLVGGSGPSTFQLAASATDSVVFGGAGSATIAAAGSNNTIPGSSGATSVTLAGSHAVFFGQAGNVSLLDAGSGDTIVAGSGSTAVTSAGAGAVLFGGSGALTFLGGASGATIAGGSGDVSVTGGSFGTTLFGDSGGAIRYTGDAGELLYAAGSGNETLDASGSSTSNQVFGGLDRSGHDLIIGGSGNDTLVAGSGSDTLTGGVASHDVFVFFSSNGGIAANDLVMNFSANDTVLLSGYGAAAAGAALSSATSSGGATTITLSDSTRITFSDIASVAGLSGRIVST
jgi:RTX calcium-binding nonapeptide repeat (4 copies)